MRDGSGANEKEAIAACCMMQWRMAGARNDCVISNGSSANASPKSSDGCTDTDETPKPPWLERKKAYIAHLPQTDSGTRLVSASDKLHNTRAILADLRKEGPKVFDRFKGKKDGTLWYYRTLVTIFRQFGDHRELVDELNRVVTEIEGLASS